ncbi:hypothetical protein [Streptomyces aureocirculatus]|uniref:hypothetical protein n=1 Tax=Streptomyces aureocirculatus TaxID=67275 RepID=UPI0004C7E5AB|nr:hypothetical protein [Streptomyces aureocirculatus]
MGTKAVDETADTSEADVKVGAEEAREAGAQDAAEGDGKASPVRAGGVDGADGVTGTDAADDAADGADGADGVDGGLDGEVDDDDVDDDVDDVVAGAGTSAAASAGVGQGAGAVVAAGLGVVGLSGGWLGTVASARESLIGQLKTSQSASVADQVQQVYGDSWKTTALIGGFFALAALVVGVGVLLRPAFGDPQRVQAPWIKSVAWGGVALGVIGLVLATAKYTDLLLGLPSTS